MRRNENGVAVPWESHPLPWRSEWGCVYDPNDDEVCRPGEQDNFIAHAANFHERLATVVGEFVRLFQRWQGDPSGFDYRKFQEEDAKLRADALALWNDLRKDGE